MPNEKGLEPHLDYSKALAELVQLAKPVRFNATPLSKKSKSLEQDLRKTPVNRLKNLLHALKITRMI